MERNVVSSMPNNILHRRKNISEINAEWRTTRVDVQYEFLNFAFYYVY